MLGAVTVPLEGVVGAAPCLNVESCDASPCAPAVEAPLGLSPGSGGPVPLADASALCAALEAALDELGTPAATGAPLEEGSPVACGSPVDAPDGTAPVCPSPTAPAAPSAFCGVPSPLAPAGALPALPSPAAGSPAVVAVVPGASVGTPWLPGAVPGSFLAEAGRGASLSITTTSTMNPGDTRLRCTDSRRGA